MLGGGRRKILHSEYFSRVMPAQIKIETLVFRLRKMSLPQFSGNERVCAYSP